MHWYNEEHRHSKVRFVTPGQRHRREDIAILAHRHRVYTDAQRMHPNRWSQHTRNWTPVGPVTLNPERDALAAAWRPEPEGVCNKQLAA